MLVGVEAWEPDGPLGVSEVEWKEKTGAVGVLRGVEGARGSARTPGRSTGPGSAAAAEEESFLN